MKYQVKDCDKLAMYPYCKVDKSWNKCEFDSMEEAIEYIHKWLGNLSPDIPSLTQHFNAGNESYEYYSYCSISIVKIKDKLNRILVEE